MLLFCFLAFSSYDFSFTWHFKMLIKCRYITPHRICNFIIILGLFWWIKCFIKCFWICIITSKLVVMVPSGNFNLQIFLNIIMLLKTKKILNRFLTNLALELNNRLSRHNDQSKDKHMSKFLHFVYINIQYTWPAICVCTSKLFIVSCHTFHEGRSV